MELGLSRHAEVNVCHTRCHEKVLRAAAEEGYEAIVKNLIENGAYTNAEVPGVSAIYVASLRNRWSIVQIFLNLRADGDASQKATKRSNNPSMV